MDCVFSVISIKFLCNPRPQRVSPCFLLEVLVLTCFVYGMSYKSRFCFMFCFVLFCIWVSVFQHHFLKNYSFSLIAFAPLSKTKLLVYVVSLYMLYILYTTYTKYIQKYIYFWTLYSIPLLYVSNIFSNTKHS